MALTDYDDALAYWYGRINYELRSAKPGDLKLHTMRSLLARLGNPQERLRIVHVAGSKGKGSTSAFLAAILQQAGHRTGLFTSPHLVDVRERMQVDGQSITREELTRLLEDVRVASERPPCLEATFFEVATAVGLLHFVRRRVDAAILEVGLGGRFDSTNVCQPAVSVITNISFDHVKQLGNTLTRIASEKAGIIKPGVPVVSSAAAAEARAVIEAISRARHAPLVQVGPDIRYRYEAASITSESWQAPRVQVQTPRRLWPWLELGLLGEHQAANAAGVVGVIEALQQLGWHLPDTAVMAGLRSVQWPARMEVVTRAPLVILDCAHNVASAQALVDTLAGCFPGCAGKRYLIFAGSNDKDLEGILRVLTPAFDKVFLTAHANGPRIVPVGDLESLLSATTVYETHADAAVAWRAARAQATAADLICITGSVFLAGQLRPVI